MGGILALLVILAFAAGTSAAQPASEDCLACHGGEGLSGTNAAGQDISVSIDAAAFAGSVHGGSAAPTATWAWAPSTTPISRW